MRPWFYAAGLEKLRARPRAKSQPIVSCKRRLVWLNNRIETKTIKTEMNTQAVGSAYHHALAQEEQLEPFATRRAPPNPRRGTMGSTISP